MPVEGGSVRVALDVNGRRVEAEVSPGVRLSAFLRGHLGLTGLKEGCCEGECGACTVLLDGKAVNACLVLAFQADGLDVVTVEGDRQDGEPLLIPVMQKGKRLGKPEPLDEIRARAAAQLARLPAGLTGLDPAPVSYRVDISPALRQLADEVDRATAEPAERTKTETT